ncbi:hypothetical protein MAPG_07205 [Magnaporthiopsis poae ATCC 64411]|uniref:Uncharacterized protein n=1 Tax=Magnaporthiopsis poae (strain ATCC 64411 / 73-15) TaxID=644358 RepID=A0A0C4E418_MAGP6|nr:hypothetical protein MAPG_07205 [Magnaporthiopsis poae ATCC 64411]
MWSRHTFLILAASLLLLAPAPAEAAGNLQEERNAASAPGPGTGSTSSSSSSCSSLPQQASATRATVTRTVTWCPSSSSEARTATTAPPSPPDDGPCHHALTVNNTAWHTGGRGPPASTDTGTRGAETTLLPVNGTGGGAPPRPSTTPPVTAGAGRETVAFMLALGVPGLAVALA